MQKDPKKLFMESYGLLRMIFGVGQLVGLSAGYFLNELVLKVPSKGKYFVVDQEILALVYLAVFLRGIFHLTAGIGIARMRDWGRQWIIYGWPVMALITFGLAHAMYSDWLLEGYVTSFWMSLSLLGVVVYVLVILFDYFFINRLIETFNLKREEAPDLSEPLEGKRVAIVFFIAVLSFSLLMYLGRPVKEGFHQGFYKSAKKKSGSAKKVTVVEQVGERAEKQPVLARSKSSAQKSDIEAVYQQRKATKIKEPSQEPSKIVSSKKALTTKPGKVEHGLAYRAMLGYIGGIFLVVGFAMQWLDLNSPGSSSRLNASSYVLMGMGFFCWIIYGLSKSLFPITLTAFLALAVCIGIVLTCFKE